MATIDERNAVVDAIRPPIKQWVAKLAPQKPGQQLRPMLSDEDALHIADAAITALDALRGGKPSMIETVFRIIMNNGRDVQEIFAKIGGLPKVFEIMPNIFRIWKGALDVARVTLERGGDPQKALADFGRRMEMHVEQMGTTDGLSDDGGR